MPSGCVVKAEIMNRRNFVTRGSLLGFVGTVPAIFGQPAVGRREGRKRMVEKTHVPHTSIHRIDVDGVTVFYREAGAAAEAVRTSPTEPRLRRNG